MLRRVLTIFSLIGLLLSMGAWGVSYWHIEYTSPARTDFVRAYGGLVMWMHDSQAVAISSGPTGWRTYRLNLKTHFWNPDQWLWTRSFTDYAKGVWALVLPLWIPTLAFGSSLAFLYHPVHRRRKRKKLGLCLKCGYDLRASKDRCPECGAATK